MIRETSLPARCTAPLACSALGLIALIAIPVFVLGMQEAPPRFGSGDGRIDVIPSLHPYSIKNGETLTVSALVRSDALVESVTADLGGVATITLSPRRAAGSFAGLAGLAEGQTTLLYEGSWVGEGLEKRVYDVTLTVTDVTGHSWRDTSLQFSDPAAGISTPGTTDYPRQEMFELGGTAPLEVFEAFVSGGGDRRGRKVRLFRCLAVVYRLANSREGGRCRAPARHCGGHGLRGGRPAGRHHSAGGGACFFRNDHGPARAVLARSLRKD